MKVSTKARYGLRALYDLALHQQMGVPVQIRAIAVRQAIPEKYLEQLFSRLKVAGLLKSVRGPKGGYLLKKSPARVTVREIFEILDGPLEPVPCTSPSYHCQAEITCAAHDFWQSLKNAMFGVLEGTTLHDLVVLQKEKENRWVNMYYI